MKIKDVAHGSCLCGGSKFEIEGPFESFFLCHCKFCQKDTGSAHGANLFSAKARLHWLDGESQINIYALPGSQHVKAFCRICGSAMPNIQMDGRLLVVPAGCLDSDLELSPNAHIYYSNRALWDDKLETFPHFDGAPSA